MANQPKKYTKFVATAATATLVASAIVPVASAAGFSDVADTNSHAVNINALAEAGIIGGYPDGTFKPNQELTRGQVVKMLGKWVEKQGFEIPADYATKARFTDLAADAKDQELVKYAALVADTGVFNGSNGALNAGGKITRENMALVLDRAFKAINDTTLVEVAAEKEDIKIADLTTAKAEAREAIQALRNLGISGVENFMPKNSVTRAQFATFLNKTIGTEVKEVELTVKEAVAVDANTVEVTLSDDTKHTVKLEKALEANKATEVKFTIDEKEFTAEVTYVVEELLVEDVKPINTKTLEVKFNQAIDTEGVTFSVKRGSAIVVLDAVFSADKKSATLSSATPLVAGDYTITVNGGDFKEGSNTATVKVEAEKETTLTIQNESVQKLADAKVAFEVKNQYGEVMNVVSSNVVATGYDKTSKDATNTAGAVTFSPVAGKTQFQANLTAASIGVGDEVLLTLSYKGLTATKTIKVEEASALATLELAAPTPLEGKQRITVGETIALPYTALDQYGEAVKLDTTTANEDTVADQEKIGDYLFTSSNPSVVDVDSITIDSEGKAQFVAAAAGTTKITAVNVKTGGVTSVDVQVSAAASEDSIVLTAPTTLVADDEKVKVPFVAYDQFGGTITPANLTTSNVTLASSNTGVATVAWNGKEIEITGTGAGTAEITATIGTKVAKFSIDIQAAAVPTKITGVKDLATVLTDGAVSTINPSKVVVKDQYGRDYKLTGTQGIAVFVKDGSETSVDVQHTGSDVAGIALATAGVVTADGTTSVATLTGKATAGTETVVLQLVSDTGNVATTAVAGGSYEVSVTNKAQADVTSYELKAIPTLFAKGGVDFTTSYAKALEVVAKDAAGNVVALPSSTVQSVTSSNTAVATVDKTSMKVLGKAKGTATISVVVNTADGLKTVQQTIEVSDDAPVAQSIKSSDEDNKLTITAANLAGKLTDSTHDLFFTVTDQYTGTELTPVDFIVSNVKDAAVAGDGFAAADITFTDSDTNGYADTIALDTSANGVAAGDSFDLTAVAANGSTVTVKVTIQ